MDISIRIKEVRLHKEMTQKVFAEYLKVSGAYIAQIELGKQPSFNFVMNLMKVTKVSAEWLMNGKGNMYQCSDLPKSNHEDMDKLFNCLREYWEKSDERELLLG